MNEEFAALMNHPAAIQGFNLVIESESDDHANCLGESGSVRAARTIFRLLEALKDIEEAAAGSHGTIPVAFIPQ